MPKFHSPPAVHLKGQRQEAKTGFHPDLDPARPKPLKPRLNRPNPAVSTALLSLTPHVWAETPEGYTSEDFASALLDQAGVSITPGNVFGPNGEGYLRLSLGMATERVQQAMERLISFTTRNAEHA